MCLILLSLFPMLIQGTTPTSKQLLFLEALVDMVTLAGPEDRDCSLKDKMKRCVVREREECVCDYEPTLVSKLLEQV